MNEYFDKELASEIYSIRKRTFEHRKQIGNNPAAFWFAPENIEGKIGTGLSLVLETQGCMWARSKSGGCTMCGYVSEYIEGKATKEKILNQFTKAIKKMEQKNPPYIVKIYTSGSFLDPHEVPRDARLVLLHELSGMENVKEIVLESRPEFVRRQILEEIKEIIPNKNIEIAIGLESSNEAIRVHSINKGFTNKLYEKAVHLSRDLGFGVRTYILFKPLFISELEAIEDAISSIDYAIKIGSTTISINPMNIQSGTLVEKIWKNGSYRSPWLWSVIEVLRRTSHYRTKVRFDCDPTAAGKERGAHNCGKCDSEALNAIRNYSLYQNPKIFDDLYCDCKKIWMEKMQYETLWQ